MTVRQSRYSKEDSARLGNDIYERQIRPLVEEGNKGKIVAINVETGEYALGENVLSAAQPLFDRNDDAQLWGMRIGYRAVHHFGRHSLRRMLY